MVAHAAGESSPGNLAPDTHVVVLAARDEAHLARVGDRLTKAGLPVKLVYEPDPPYGGQLMAVGVVPMKKEVVRRLVSELPLLR